MNKAPGEVFEKDHELRKILSQMEGKAESGRKDGLMFEIWGGSGFGSYQKVSDEEVLFKEYDDLGYTTWSGKVMFTSDGETVRFAVELNGEVNEIIEGWMALVKKKGKGAEVYFPWRLVNSEEKRKLMEKVLGAYEQATGAKYEIDLAQGFVASGVGFSGEEEGKVGLVVKSWGKL